MTIRIGLIVGLISLCTGCTSLWLQGSHEVRGASSSPVSYLFPHGQRPPDKNAKAQLNLPLRVGLAFVPSPITTPGLSQADKQALLARVKDSFSNRDYIQDIIIIPDAYLQQSRGVSGVEQLGRLYQLDVVGLVSYDQAVMMDDRKSSFFYWTIVGAYVVKGNQSEVNTFVDLAVIDVESKKLLLRAAGVSNRRQNSTLVDALKETRTSRRNGFAVAMESMISNLDLELTSFQEAVSMKNDIEVVRHHGGGSLGLYLILGIIVLVCVDTCSVSERRFQDRLHNDAC